MLPERVDLWQALGDLRPQVRATILLNVVDDPAARGEIAARNGTQIVGPPPGR